MRISDWSSDVCSSDLCLQDAADVVHNQRGQGFAFDAFGNDQQRTAGLGNLFQDRQQIADVADFLVENQYIRIFKHRNLLVGVVDEVGRQVAAVELHAFDDVQFVFQRFAVLNGNNAFLADLVHGVGDDFANRCVAVGGNGTDLGNFLAGGARLGQLAQLFDGNGNRFVDAAFQVHGVEDRKSTRLNSSH